MLNKDLKKPCFASKRSALINAQNDQSFPDSISKIVFLGSNLYSETMKHIFPEICLLKLAKLQGLP